ncbi:MAG: hypothetical protein H0X45_06640 [Planctomycetes bacterium]|nr:hypothetical protein [Planctomycetota bacterium]
MIAQRERRVDELIAKAQEKVAQEADLDLPKVDVIATEGQIDDRPLPPLRPQ